MQLHYRRPSRLKLDRITEVRLDTLAQAGSPPTSPTTNQRGDETVKATAVIALPSEGKPVLYPDVPRDLQERATQMMARHRELSARKKG